MAYKIGRSGKAIVAVLIVVAILIPILLTGALVYGITPKYTPPATPSSPTSSSSSSTGTGSGVTVNMPQNIGSDQSLNFSPASINVAAGTTVTFVDQDSQSGAPHNVTWETMPAGAHVMNSPITMSAGQSFSVTLTTPGTYTYHCTFHTWMTGTIVVVAPLS